MLAQCRPEDENIKKKTVSGCCSYDRELPPAGGYQCLYAMLMPNTMLNKKREVRKVRYVKGESELLCSLMV
jgi:hypothetical protein